MKRSNGVADKSAEKKESNRILFEYNTKRYDAATVRRYTDHGEISRLLRTLVDAALSEALKTRSPRVVLRKIMTGKFRIEIE